MVCPWWLCAARLSPLARIVAARARWGRHSAPPHARAPKGSSLATFFHVPRDWQFRAIRRAESGPGQCGARGSVRGNGCGHDSLNNAASSGNAHAGRACATIRREGLATTICCCLRLGRWLHAVSSAMLAHCRMQGRTSTYRHNCRQRIVATRRKPESQQ